MLYSVTLARQHCYDSIKKEKIIQKNEIYIKILYILNKKVYFNIKAYQI